jgi:ferredoxin
VGAISFGGEWSLSWGYEYDPSRRQILASLATGAVGVGLLNTGLLKSKNPYLLRPPGAKEEQFLTQCVRCGRCIKVCPNSALRPTLFEAGLEGIWTPMLVPRLGYCDYSCNACGQVCPSEAIPPLPLGEKRKAVIGTAQVDRDRCISCMICPDMCPVGAIEVVEVEREGMMVMLPQVVPELCTGCGICEYVCPVEGVAAIRVYAPGAPSGS